MSAPAPLEASRFYAITPERLSALVAKRILTAPAAVLAYVEMTARPGCPRAYSLEGIADALGFGVDAVRRAVRRLLRERLLVGSFEGNRYQLAPATYAFEGKSTKAAPKVSEAAVENLVDPPGFQKSANLAIMQGSAPEEAIENLAAMQGCDRSEPVSEGVSPTPHVNKLKIKKLKASELALQRELAEDWNLYPRTAIQLLEAHGERRVQEVVSWGHFLKAHGQLQSLGYVKAALDGGYAAPNGFYESKRAAQAPQEGHVDASQAQVPQVASERAATTILDGRLEAKLYNLRTEYQQLLARPRSPFTEAAHRGIREKARTAGVPWEMIVAVESLE